MTVRSVALVLSVLGAALVSGCSGVDLRPLLSTGADSRAGLGRTDEAAWYAHGKVHLREGRLGLAVQSFRMALNINPRSVAALNGLGAAYDQLKRFDLADKAYLDALALAPADSVTLNNLGWSRVMRGEPQLGAFYLRQALDETPDHPVMRANLRVAVTAADEGDTPPRLMSAAGPMPVPSLERRSAREVLVRTVAAAAVRPPAPQVQDATALDGLERVSRATGSGEAPPPSATMPRVEWRDRRIEVSNGTGRSRMARRMRDWFAGQNVPVARLTNAAHFAHQTSVIGYRTVADKAVAVQLARLLPGTPRLRHIPGQFADVRLILGADLLGFDGQLSRKGQGHDVNSHAI